MSRDVVVPDGLREVVLAGLMAEINRRRGRDQVSRLTPQALALIAALKYGGDAPEAVAFANESVLPESGTVVLTTRDIAAELGCSEQWARTIAHQIGTRVGRQWLTDKTTFEHWRHSA